MDARNGLRSSARPASLLTTKLPLQLRFQPLEPSSEHLLPRFGRPGDLRTADKATELELSFGTKRVSQLGGDTRIDVLCSKDLLGPAGCCGSAQWRLSELRTRTQFLGCTEESAHRRPGPGEFRHLLYAGGNLGCLAHSSAGSQSKGSIEEDRGSCFTLRLCPETAPG